MHCSTAPTHFIEVTTLSRMESQAHAKWYSPTSGGKYVFRVSHEKSPAPFPLGSEATVFEQESRPLQNVCDSAWQRHWFYIKVRGSILEGDKARHQSCHLASRTKEVTRGEWNKFDAGLAPAPPIRGRPPLQSCCGRSSFNPFSGKLYLQLFQQQDMVFLLLFPTL